MFGLGTPEVTVLLTFFLAIGFFVLPFIINYKLAQSRGKSVALMMVLTLIFSWIVTLVLAFLPTEQIKRGGER